MKMKIKGEMICFVK